MQEEQVKLKRKTLEGRALHLLPVLLVGNLMIHKVCEKGVFEPAILFWIWFMDWDSIIVSLIALYIHPSAQSMGTIFVTDPLKKNKIDSKNIVHNFDFSV